MRSAEQLLDAYNGNQDVDRDECRRLYDLVDDPWGLGSALNYSCYTDIVRRLNKYMHWRDIDWIIDYGAGIGTFTRAVKDEYPHIKSLGIDFDTAQAAAERRFGSDIFDHFFAMDRDTNEYDLLRHRFPYLSISRLGICFINSSNYVFKDLKKRKRIRALSRLISHLEHLASQKDCCYLLASSNFSDKGAIQAIESRDRHLVYLSRDLELDSEIPDFKAELHTRVWRQNPD